MKYHTFQDLLGDIESRLNQIELDRELFSISQSYYADDGRGTIMVYYCEQLIVRFYYFRSNYINGSRYRIRGSITVKRHKYPEWYDECKNHMSHLDVHVDEYYRAHVNGNENNDLKYYLDEYLPIGFDESRNEVDTCLRRHNFSGYHIAFDTYAGRYVIEMDLESCLKVPKEEKKDMLYLFKYTSLATYCSMLNHRSFRMNSIVAMNDASETLWADFVTGDEEIDDKTYYNSVVRNRNKLVTSFTPMWDNATMWRLYGNNGNGVCLSFEVPVDEVTKVLYVGEKDAGFQQLKQVKRELSEKGIKVDFQDLDRRKLYIKSSSFSVEVEYRYVYDAKDEILDIANYGSMLSPYKDFPYKTDLKKFAGLPFRFIGVTIGKNIPYFRTLYPLLVAETDRRFPGVEIRESDRWELR